MNGGGPEAPTRHGIALLLSDHHRRLEGRGRELLAWALANDSRHVIRAWAELEAELLDHMAAEEAIILPSYALHAPADARRILDDHTRFRSLLATMDIDVELHQIRAGRLRRLVEALEVHSASEDAVMYPWATEHIALVAQRLLFTQIGSWIART